MPKEITMKEALKEKALVPKFELGQMVRHTPTGVEGAIHHIKTQQIVNTQEGQVIRQLPFVVYTIVYLDKTGVLQPFETQEMFFESV